MPSKSRHSRGKQSFQGKKRKGKRIPTVTVAQEQAVSPTEPPATPARRAAPPLSAPTPTPPPAASHPHIAAELRRIGILAGIMLAALAVLAFTLP
jgi:hypothetical protein